MSKLVVWSVIQSNQYSYAFPDNKIHTDVSGIAIYYIILYTFGSTILRYKNEMSPCLFSIDIASFSDSFYKKRLQIPTFIMRSL